MKKHTLPLCLALSAVFSANADHGNDPWFKLGGGARFNYAWRDYGPSSKFKPDLVQLNASGEYGRLFGSAQYRWYDGFDTVYYAWLGWKLENTEDTQSDIRAGVVNVPFGLLAFWPLAQCRAQRHLAGRWLLSWSG